MRRIDPSKKEIIAEYIDKHFCENDEIPSVRDIVEGTGIPLSTVHRYLISMREDGALDYSGRRTARTKMMEDTAPIHALQVLGTVAVLSPAVPGRKRSSVSSSISACRNPWWKKEITSP